jgi:hypothetical protein
MKYALIITFLASINSFGQSKIGVKLYQNTDFFDATYYNSQANEFEEISHINFNRFSVAIDINGKNNLNHEIEAFIPEITRSITHVQFPLEYEFRRSSSFESKISSYALRYEINKTLTHLSKPLAFNVGLALNPYFVNVEYEPNNSATFYRSEKYYGGSFNVIPRMIFRLSNRFTADLNVPFKIFDIWREEDQVNNPFIPITQQRKKDWNHSFLEDAYTIRLGITYYFSD